MTRYHQPTLMEDARAMPSWTVDPDGTHGEVFTRRWVVDLILDLAGYRAVEDLGASVIVEPACGTGAFLVPIVERLAESCTRHGRSLADSGQAIRAFDVLARNVDTASPDRSRVLAAWGCASAEKPLRCGMMRVSRHVSDPLEGASPRWTVAALVM